MTEITPLHEAILELGLEDWIPLPEAISNPEIRAFLPSKRSEIVIGHALVDLLRLDRIQVWTGYWEDEPVVVNSEAAEMMVLDERRYSFDSEDTGLMRVYYVNVDNFRG